MNELDRSALIEAAAKPRSMVRRFISYSFHPTPIPFEGEPHPRNDSHAYPISHNLVDACELPWLGAAGMTRLLTALL
jgi:hypothetical protein